MAPLTQSISERFSQSIAPVNSAVHSMASSAQSACCCQESVTAKLCAFARAFYAQSPAGSRPIFRDEKAYALMGRDEYENMGRLIQCVYRPECLKCPCGAVDWAKAADELKNYIAPVPLSRAAYAEEKLELYTEQFGQCQYVICGAGMDTYSLRCRRPNIVIYEIDRPETQEYKRARLAELNWNRLSARTHYVPANFFADDWMASLIHSGFDPERPAFFSILGLTYYLSLPVFEKMLRQIARISSAGTQLVFDFPDEMSFSPSASESFVHLAKIASDVGEPMRGGFSPAQIATALMRCGQEIQEHLTPQKIQQRFFEGQDGGLNACENVHFILAKKISSQLSAELLLR